MVGPSSQILKYFHIQRSQQLSSIVGQLDKAAQLVSELLKTDFIAVIYRRPKDDSIILVACNNRNGVEVKQLNLLDKQWSGVSISDDLDALRIIDLNISELSENSHPDPFAIANKFRYRTTVSLGEDCDLSAMIATYWLEEPAEVSDEIARCLTLVLELVISTMSMADDLHEVNDYSVRLARLMSILDSGICETFPGQISTEITRIAGSLCHNGGACFMTIEDGSSQYSIREVSGEDDHKSGLLEKITDAVSDKLSDIDMSQDMLHELRLVDISDCITDECKSAVAVNITPDKEHRCVLVFWTNQTAGFTESDLELQSVFAELACNVLTYAVNIERISKSKRTLEKSSTRMADTEAMAALTDMTTGLAHEFNNVMGGIVGHVQLMKMKIDNGPLTASLNLIESLAMEGAETVRRIQEFTRRSQNKKFAPVDLANILGMCLDYQPSTWRQKAETTEVKIVCTDIPETAFIDGDTDDLTTLINKLIENAVEHSHQGGTVEVALMQNKSRWHLTVTDQGDGIPEAIRKKVYYPFFTTKTTRGAGLGLAIVHGIVVSHGGKIEIEDGTDNGTVFRVTLKHSDGVRDDSDLTNRGRASERLQILVVDDDEQIRGILSDMLDIEGHSSTACADGYQALEAIDTQPYDLVITDLGMPGMSGLELAAIVHQKFPELPIAMITGWGSQIDEEDALLNGIKIVLSKPFHLKDVKSLVTELTVR